VGQMTQMTITGFEIKGQEGVFDMVKLRDGIQNHNIGSILNVPTGAPSIQNGRKL
jgi:beta-glucosidase